MHVNIHMCIHAYTHKYNTSFFFLKLEWVGKIRYILLSEKQKLDNQIQKSQVVSGRVGKLSKRQEINTVYSEKLLPKYSEN